MLKCPSCGNYGSMGTWFDGVNEECDSCLIKRDKAENPDLYNDSEVESYD